MHPEQHPKHGQQSVNICELLNLPQMIVRISVSTQNNAWHRVCSVSFSRSYYFIIY